ncbi:alpha-mannosidase [Paenibacillus marinisediminis]
MIRINRWIEELAAQCWLECRSYDDWNLSRGTYILPGEYTVDVEGLVGSPNDIIIDTYGTTYWLRKQLNIPTEWNGSQVGLIVRGGGEGLLRIDGVSYHGVDRNHWFVPLPVDKVGYTPNVEIELYDPIPEPIDPLNNQQVRNPSVRSLEIQLVHVNAAVQSLLYTVTVVRDTARLLPQQELKRQRLLDILRSAMDAMRAEQDRGAVDPNWVHELDLKLREQVRADVNLRPGAGYMHLVGQSHIDIAWLWPVRETVRKSSRTFSTVNTLMEQYPEYRYSQSQPQLYAFVKEHDPELFEKIKQRVAEGRWELVGGMWLEPDLNIPSGESLARQLLYGQLFYQREFGKRSHIEWLPDTFGYCASLPQMLKLAGMNAFMTTKLGWNDTNQFPYDLFQWVGIDGTAMLSYQNHGVNENTTPKDISEHWQSFKEKSKHPEQMLLYGHGDGGGGVTREMIEYAQRAELMTDLPNCQFSTAEQFFEGILASEVELPKWHGDLYLELHRGTYTTHARNKRSNRMAEVLYREAEIWNYAAPLLANRSSSIKDQLVQGWKLILLNQFHDIIPGTSITETYETSAKEYNQVFDIGNQVLAAGMGQLAEHIAAQGEGEPYIVFNSLSWSRSGIIRIEGGEELRHVAVYDDQGNRLESDWSECDSNGEDRVALDVWVSDIPSFGYRTIWLRQASIPAVSAELAASERLVEWETENYKLRFNSNGAITSWFDKNAGRELIKAGGAANELQLFHDRPTYWDAWDIDSRYEQQAVDGLELVDSKVVLRGKTMDVLRFSWKLGESAASTIQQDMIFYHQQKRVDFKTKVDWQETHKLLKVAFPIDVATVKATYEIPFGALERPTHRNTSWEQAQYEVCGHRWVDVSESGYGVSLLNDCKYGYDVQDSTIRLSLLRAPRWPDNTADLGEHQFTYSLYPHEQDWRQAHTVREAMELNHPLQSVKHQVGKGSLPSEHSLLPYESKHVILDSIKDAEDGTGLVIRLYESSGGRDQACLSMPDGIDKVYLANLLEDTIEEIETVEGQVKLAFKPYEIKTLKLMYKA